MFFSGLIPALVLVSNPAIQFVCYEQCTRLLLRVRSRAAGKAVTVLSADDYFVLGALAKAVATVVTYPLLTVKSRMQGGKSTYLGFVDGLQRMAREEGVGAMYHGIEAKFVQTVLNAAFMFATYETFLQWTKRLVG